VIDRAHLCVRPAWVSWCSPVGNRLVDFTDGYAEGAVTARTGPRRPQRPAHAPKWDAFSMGREGCAISIPEVRAGAIGTFSGPLA
jgi:hypothetical protein